MTQEPHNQTNPEPLGSGELRIDYEKGVHFRVIHVDGGHGGVSPAGDYIVLSVYSERYPIPQREIQAVKDGFPGGPPRRVQRDANIFREVEATLVMNLPTAEGFTRWFAENIEKLKVAQAAREKLLAGLKRPEGEAKQ